MAFPSLLFPSPVFTITNEQFNSFHSIERELYSRLVLTIGRDQTESMHVIALWLWLEYHSENGRNFVHKMLSFSDRFVNMLAEESVACLRCMENSYYLPISRWRDENTTPMLHSVIGGQINLFYFMENRATILLGVHEIIRETCLRAFEDIFLVRREVQSAAPIPPFEREGVAFGDYEEEIREVEADQRTIFLTFSKGYPTSEFEVREFFTRRYGDIVEAVHMQEVLAEEQALYARLVVRSARVFDVVLEGESKRKFTINGKHVWARKYVKKHNQTK